jgi:hypothetical protein
MGAFAPNAPRGSFDGYPAAIIPRLSIRQRVNTPAFQRSFTKTHLTNARRIFATLAGTYQTTNAAN